jgi:hypothetical protein
VWRPQFLFVIDDLCGLAAPVTAAVELARPLSRHLLIRFAIAYVTFDVMCVFLSCAPTCASKTRGHLSECSVHLIVYIMVSMFEHMLCPLLRSIPNGRPVLLLTLPSRCSRGGAGTSDDFTSLLTVPS